MYMNSDSLTETIVLSLSDVKGVDPLDLPPLYDAIDTDALEQLFARDEDGIEVTFVVAGCEVTVRGGDDVTVTPTTEHAPSTAGIDGGSDAVATSHFQD